MPETTTTRAYSIGDKVIISEHWIHGEEDEHSRPPTIVDLTTNGYCRACHCDPVNPDHKTDASQCCPGPWYVVEYWCPDDPGHTHREVYAEHELTTECKTCGWPTSEHVNQAPDCSIVARDANGDVLTLTDEQAARMGLI